MGLVPGLAGTENFVDCYTHLQIIHTSSCDRGAHKCPLHIASFLFLTVRETDGGSLALYRPNIVPNDGAGARNDCSMTKLLFHMPFGWFGRSMWSLDNHPEIVRSIGGDRMLSLVKHVCFSGTLPERKCARRSSSHYRVVSPPQGPPMSRK